MTWNFGKMPTLKQADRNVLKAYMTGAPIKVTPLKWNGGREPSSYFYETLSYSRFRPERRFGYTEKTDRIYGRMLTVPIKAVLAVWGDCALVRDKGWVSLDSITLPYLVRKGRPMAHIANVAPGSIIGEPLCNSTCVSRHWQPMTKINKQQRICSKCAQKARVIYGISGEEE